MHDGLHDSDPRRIGEYVVESRLGAGGMGVVYLARDSVGTLVAVKVIRPELLDRGNGADIVRFRREIAALRRLDRFCTARLIGADPEADPPHLVTEFVSGPTLREAVTRDGPLRGADLESVAIGIAAALRHIHAAGITHRDLKPGNVLLSPYGPRVIDFGLALHDEVSRRVTAEFAVGTPGYMAPEQLRVADVGSPADVFAWGAVVAFAATGRPPFGSGNAQAVGFRVLGGEADLDGLEGALRAIVTAALAKDPARRPTSDQLVDELRHLAIAPKVLATATDAPPARSGFSEPADAAGWAELAGRSLAEGKAQLALFQAEKGLGLRSHDARCHHQRGLALLALERRHEAISALRLAHEIDPTDDVITRSYTRALLGDGENGARRAYDVAPDDETVRKRYAEILLNRAADRVKGADDTAFDRLLPEARKDLQRAYRIAPDDEEVRRRYSLAMEAEGAGGLAEAYHIAPDDPEIQARYVTTLLGQGDEGITKAFRIAPQDGTVADRYIGLLRRNTDYRQVVDQITSMWDQATAATKAAVWTQLPSWIELCFFTDSYDRERALAQEQTVDRLLALAPPPDVARRLWRLGAVAFENRAGDRLGYTGCGIVPVWIGLSLLEIFVREAGWLQDCLIVVVLGFFALATIGFTYEYPGPVERRRRVAFDKAARPYARSRYTSPFPSDYEPGPDFGTPEDYAVVIRPFVARRSWT